LAQSVCLTIRDPDASKAFDEKFGFNVFAGDTAEFSHHQEYAEIAGSRT